MQNRGALNAMIDGALASGRRDDWITRLNRAGVPLGQVQSTTAALADPQVAAQEMVLRVPHEGHGEVAMTGFPIKFSQTPLSVRLTTPDLGTDGWQVLLDAGFDDAEINALIGKGVLGLGSD